jgi:hypothetical protein
MLLSSSGLLLGGSVDGIVVASIALSGCPVVIAGTQLRFLPAGRERDVKPAALAAVSNFADSTADRPAVLAEH